jgi:glycosyltransferase involved in cell wall biosynthesis
MPEAAPSAHVALSLVLPVYDEEGNIRGVIDEVEPVLRGITPDYEIVCVNDGSRDGTAAVLADIARANPRVTVWTFDRNHGISSALHCGFNEARGDLIATMDADMQNDPADLPRLVEAIRAGADMACGWRHARKDPFVKRVSSRIANGWRNWRMGTSIHDVTCPLKVFRRDVRTTYYPFHGLHRFLPTLAEMGGFKVVEIPVNHRPRHSGSSKYGVWNRVFRGMRDMKAVTWMRERHMTYRATRLEPPGPTA